MGDVMSLSFLKYAFLLGLTVLASQSAWAEYAEYARSPADTIIEEAFDNCSKENETKAPEAPKGCKCKYQDKINSLTHLIKPPIGETAFLSAVEDLDKCK
jgi:hypothetical protein